MTRQLNSEFGERLHPFYSELRHYTFLSQACDLERSRRARGVSSRRLLCVHTWHRLGRLGHHAGQPQHGAQRVLDGAVDDPLELEQRLEERHVGRARGGALPGWGKD